MTEASQTVRSTTEPPGDGGEPAWRRVRISLLVLILGLAGFTRTHRLADVGVSFDESIVQRTIEFSWTETFDRIARDTHPPLFYVLLKLWVNPFGDSVFAARLLTAAWGVIAVGGLYLFIREAYGDKSATNPGESRRIDNAALIAAAVLALSPMHIFWTQQIRMYSLAIGLTTLSSYFLMRAIRVERGTPLEWCRYTVSAILLSYSHYVALFVIAVQLLFALGVRCLRGRDSLVDRVIAPLAAGCCVSLAWQVWLPSFLEQRARVISHFYLPSLDWQWFGRTMHELWIGKGTVLSPLTGLVIAQVSLVVLLAVLLGRRRGDLFLFLATVVPIVALAFISWTSRPIFTARYMQFSHVFLIAGIGVLLSRLPGVLRTVGTAALLAWIGGAYYEYYQWRESIARLPGMRTAMQHVDELRGPKEPLIVSNPMLFTSALTYLKDRTNAFNYFPQSGYPFYQGTPVMRDSQYVTTEWIRNSEAKHVWTLDGERNVMGRVPMPSEWRLRREQRFREWYSPLVVRLYSLKKRFDGDEAMR